MSRGRVLLVLAVSSAMVSGLACQMPNPAFDSDSQAGDSDTSTSTTKDTKTGETGGMEVGDGDPGDGEPGDGDPGDGDPSTAPGDGDPNPGDGDGDPDLGLCELGYFFTEHEACATCLDPDCCEPLAGCVNDFQCSCTLECALLGNGSLPMCLMDCSQGDPNAVPGLALMDVGLCFEGCADACLLPAG